MPIIRVSFRVSRRNFCVRGFRCARGSLGTVKQFPLVTFELPQKGTR